MAIMSRLRYLRHGRFSRVRFQRRLLAFLAAQDTRLTASATGQTVDTDDIAAAAAAAVLTFGANAQDGETVTIGEEVYTFKDTALTEVKASGDLVTDATNPVDNSTVVIGTVTYTFQASLTPGTANNVHVDIGANAEASLLNLARAINNSGGTPGTDYDTTGTGAHPVVESTTSVTGGTTITLTALEPGTAGNVATTASTSPDSHIDPEAATLTGGVNAVVNEVLIGATASDSLDNLIAAITGDTGEGTVYGTGTVAHTLVDAAAGTGDTMDVTALTEGFAGNNVALATDVTSASWDEATLVGGLDASFGPTLTATSHTFSNGEGPYVMTAETALPGGYVAGTLVWVGVEDADTIGLAKTREQAVRGEYMSFTSAGTGALTLTKAMTNEGIYNMLRTNKPETVAAASDVDSLS